ncbi:zinc metallopeptidase [Maribrevibacterium harenarium]|uniref:Zinc metallopeptidase n=1 Tax=Maribrevibacterium harenarium TaxID=2589817 RepID=A0A501WI26_9GAMM|nr:zinc metallopeptidase [Maribrevibacterium harenarium]TPE49169.1 zinc metallopeptidase [Maribrevibacterium harenarium]
MVALVAIAVILLFFGPSLWVKRVLSKYRALRVDLPGTGGELARHLIQRYQLEGVTVEVGQEGQDHYDILAKTIRLSPYVYDGQSLTAVAVATHEVGHAIAHHRQDTVAKLRTRYLPWAMRLQRLAFLLLIIWPILSLALRLPYLPVLHIGVVALMGIMTVFIQLAILPEEWDASFNKALPILREGNYVSERDLPKIKRILTACAMTYVAAALRNILLFWRLPR